MHLLQRGPRQDIFKTHRHWSVMLTTYLDPEAVHAEDEAYKATANRFSANYQIKIGGVRQEQAQAQLPRLQSEEAAAISRQAGYNDMQNIQGSPEITGLFPSTDHNYPTGSGHEEKPRVLSRFLRRQGSKQR